jgi:hypothetical protein
MPISKSTFCVSTLTPAHLACRDMFGENSSTRSVRERTNSSQHEHYHGCNNVHLGFVHANKCFTQGLKSLVWLKLNRALWSGPAFSH